MKDENVRQELQAKYEGVTHFGVKKDPNEVEKEQEQLGGGGHFVEMQSSEYDLVLNVLLGIRRGLADLSNRVPDHFTRS